jgi:predicted Rossmann-fold nucleotide-binding protein
LLAWLKATVLKSGAITESDFELLRVFDDPKDIVDAVVKWYTKQEVIGTRVL